MAGDAAVAGDEAHRRGQVAAGAVAAHRQPGAVAAERGGFLRGPAGGGVAVLEPHGELVLRREPVFDGDDDAAARLRDAAGHRFARIDGADHPPAAVEVHDDRERPRTVGNKDPHRHVAVGTFDRPVLHPRHVRPWHTRRRVDGGAALLDSRCSAARGRHSLGERAGDGFGLWVQRHGPLLWG